MRKLGIDYGDSRIGLALSDPMGIIASALETFVRFKDNRDFEYLAKVVQTNEVDTIVVGLPKNMDGTEGIRVELTRAFCEQLKGYTSANIVFRDERLTSMQAERTLLEADLRRDKRKQLIDKMAAQIILQSYLDTKR